MTDREFLGKMYFLLQHEHRATVICDQLEDMLAERLAQPETVMAKYTFQTYAAYKNDGEMKIGVVPDDAPLRTHWEGCEEVHPECKKTRRREWVGLTRDEVLDIAETETHPLAFYRAIEAKLKEKNNA
jgi:hypothetical protein